jgi:hypothetical protein
MDHVLHGLDRRNGRQVLRHGFPEPLRPFVCPLPGSETLCLATTGGGDFLLVRPAGT